MAITKITTKSLADASVTSAKLASSISIGTLTITSGISGNVAFDTNTLFVDAANDRVGVGTITPTTTLDVSGTFKVSGNATIPSIIDNTSFADDVEVLGALTVTGQPALSALGDNHVMTKGLHDDYFLGFGPKWKSWQAANSTNDGVTFNNSTADQIFNWTSSASPVSPFQLAGEGQLSFDNKVFMLEMRMSRLTFGNSSSVFWFVVGELFNKAVPVVAPTKKGFGFKATSTGVRLWAHDGTTLFEGSELAYTLWTTATDWKLSYYNGQVSGFLNSTVIPSLTGGPTGSATNLNHVCSFQIAAASANSGFGFHNIRSLAYPA